MTSLVTADQCYISSIKIYNTFTDEVISRDEIVHFFLFKELSLALDYAHKNNISEKNIIKDQKLGYYVFHTLPNKIFTCIKIIQEEK